MRRGKRAIAKDPAWCYLCGLQIPVEVVSSSHPLFGTVDHVVPRSRAGSGAIYNRYPAHRICNLTKGDGLVHPEGFAREIHQHVAPLLHRLGYTVTPRAQNKAVQRVLVNWPTWAPKLIRETNQLALERWEDDGGSVLNPPQRRLDPPSSFEVDAFPTDSLDPACADHSAGPTGGL